MSLSMFSIYDMLGAMSRTFCPKFKKVWHGRRDSNPNPGINTYMKQCPTCNNEVLKRGNKFCSQSCANSFNNLGVRRHSNPKSKYSLVKPCKTCGKETPRPTYCSDACNPNLLKMSLEEKKHRHAAMHREAWQRYQAKLKNQTPANVDKKALQEFYLNCPEGYEVDHIIPVSKGGLHCLTNLQYLTISENRKKSNKIL